MKTFLYSLILSGILNFFTVTSYAQGKIKNKIVKTDDIQDKLRKWGKFQDAYLMLLSKEERKELFYQRRQGDDITFDIRERFAKEQEERFQRIKQKYDKMTDVQRDSILSIRFKRSDNVTVDIIPIIVDEQIFRDNEISINNRIREIIEVFRGQKIYLYTVEKVTTKRTNKSQGIIFYQTMDELLSWVSVRYTENWKSRHIE